MSTSGRASVHADAGTTLARVAGGHRRPRGSRYTCAQIVLRELGLYPALATATYEQRIAGRARRGSISGRSRLDLLSGVPDRELPYLYDDFCKAALARKRQLHPDHGGDAGASACFNAGCDMVHRAFRARGIRRQPA